MMLWVLVGVMTVVALAFVLLPVLKPDVGRKPILIVGIAVLVPVLAIMGYQKLGSPDAASLSTNVVTSGQPQQAGMPPGHPPSDVMNMDIGKLAERLAEKMKANPDNPEGWALLARTYVALKRHAESLPAFEKAATLLPKDPHLLADYADALAMSNNGKFDAKSVGLVDQALAIDSLHVKALMLKATIAFNQKDYQHAIEYWQKLLTVPGLDAETTKQATGSIEEAKHVMASK